MLSEFQRLKVWENLLGAETRSLYFAALATRYTGQKQWITGFTFFLSFGAAATMIGKAPVWLPISLALIAAVLSAYSMAVNLDAKAGTMVKLHASWAGIAADYERLWNHTYDEDAESQFEAIVQKESSPSELAATDAPNDQALLGRWQERVFSLHHLTDQHG